VREPLAFKPGDRWSYSNSNYALLGAIIEKLSGMPYEQYLAREFFEPLGLKSLHHCESKPARPKLATGYHVRDGKPAPAEIENMNWARGDGGLCGTAGDLAKWARELAKGRAVTAESYRQMVSSKETKDGVRPSYGFGVSLVELDDRTPRISHGGAVSGFSNTLAYYPEKDLAIAVLTNRSGIWAQAIEQRIRAGVAAAAGAGIQAATAHTRRAPALHRHV
jgi:CubicO group peptidase (beta-lactamase class C family)